MSSGGVRPGAGRKPIKIGERSKGKQIMLAESEWDSLEKLAGPFESCNKLATNILREYLSSRDAREKRLEIYDETKHMLAACYIKTLVAKGYIVKVTSSGGFEIYQVQTKGPVLKSFAVFKSKYSSQVYQVFMIKSINSLPSNEMQ